MPVRFEHHGSALRAVVHGGFKPEDALQIEEVAGESPGEHTILVDLAGTGDKQMLALWMIAQAARRRPGLLRLTGLTLADTRFLAMLDLAGQAGATH